MQRWLELVTDSNSNLALSDLGIRVVAAMMALLSWGAGRAEDDGGHVLGGTGRRRRIGDGERIRAARAPGPYAWDEWPTLGWGHPIRSMGVQHLTVRVESTH